MDIPDYMTAAVLTGHGGSDKLVIRDIMPVPKPGANEVLIKVGACGMNNTDINTRIGWYSKSVGSGTNSIGVSYARAWILKKMPHGEALLLSSR